MPNGYLDILYLDIDFIVSKIDFLLCLKAYAFSALFLLESNIAKSELNVFKLAKEQLYRFIGKCCMYRRFVSDSDSHKIWVKVKS